jgi:hypothetical protein
MRFITTSLGVAGLAALAAVPAAAPAASTPRCHTADLSAKVGAVSPGAGQRNANLTLTNRSRHACRTQGYVGLQLVSVWGEKIPTSTVRTGGPAPLVRLAPGAKAVASLQWGVIAGGNEPVNGPCEHNPPELLVTPPNETRQITTTWTQGPVCQRGRFQVGPLRKA